MAIQRSDQRLFQREDETVTVKILKIRKRNILDILKWKFGEYFAKCDVDGEIIEVGLYDFHFRSETDFRIGIVTRIDAIMEKRKPKPTIDFKKFEGWSMEI